MMSGLSRNLYVLYKVWLKRCEDTRTLKKQKGHMPKILVNKQGEGCIIEMNYFWKGE